MISESNIIDNLAKFKGGGFHLKNIEYISINNTKFHNNSVQFDSHIQKFNKSVDYYLSFGGAISIYNGLKSSQLNIEQSIFDSNKVPIYINK